MAGKLLRRNPATVAPAPVTGQTPEATGSLRFQTFDRA